MRESRKNLCESHKKIKKKMTCVRVIRRQSPLRNSSITWILLPAIPEQLNMHRLIHHTWALADYLCLLFSLCHPPTMGEQWLLKQFRLNHPVEHIQTPKLPKLYVKVETSTTYFIIHNQFVKNCSLSDQLFCSIFLQSPSRQQSYQIIDCKW